MNARGACAALAGGSSLSIRLRLWRLSFIIFLCALLDLPEVVAGLEVVDVEGAVEVVGLVLQGLGQQPVGLDADDLAVQVKGPDPDPLGALDGAPVAGNAEAALFDLPLSFPPDDLRD